MKKFGCMRFVLLVLVALSILYFTVGEGKTVILKKIFPIKYQEYVEMYSNEYSLDKNLVYAIIRTESNFDKDAQSVVGAKGLMQLMEKTAEECNNKAGFGYNIPSDLFVAERNIRLGCYYLKHLIDVYGNAEMAVVAYNGGTGNVNEWLKDPDLSDGAGGLYEIPYEETRKYKEKVFKTFEMYNKIYKTNE